MNLLTQITFGELVNFLKTFKEDVILSPGLKNPRIYRGAEFSIALESTPSVTVGELLYDITRLFREGFSMPNNEDMLVFNAPLNQYGRPITLEFLIASVESWKNIGDNLQDIS